MNNDPNNMNNPYGQGGYPGGMNAGGYPGTAGMGGYAGTPGASGGMSGYPNGAMGYPSGTGGYSGNMGGYQNANMGTWSTGMGTYTEPYPAAEPKKRTGMIVAIAAAVAVVIGCIIALVALSSSSSSTPRDPVSVAVSRLLSGEAPTGLAVDGKVDFTTSSNSSFTKSAAVRLKSELMTDSLINSTTMSVGLVLYNGSDVSLKLSESYTGDEGLYIKVDGASVALQNLQKKNATSDDDDDDDNSYTRRSSSKTTTTKEVEVSDEYLACLQDIDNTRDCSDLLDNTDAATLEQNSQSLQALTTVLGALGSVDGQWLLVPTNTTSTGILSTGEVDGQCVTGLVGDMQNSRDALAEAYDNNPFIVSLVADAKDEDLSDLEKQVLAAMSAGVSGSTDEDDEDYDEEGEDSESAASQDLTYQVTFDEELLASFADEIAGASLSGLDSCLKKNSGTKAEQIVEFLQQMPTMFVELDDDFNFSKVYLGWAPDSKSSVVVGLDLSYPENVTVTKPGQHKNLSEVLQQLQSAAN